MRNVIVEKSTQPGPQNGIVPGYLLDIFENTNRWESYDSLSIRSNMVIKPGTFVSVSHSFDSLLRLHFTSLNHDSTPPSFHQVCERDGVNDRFIGRVESIWHLIGTLTEHAQLKIIVCERGSINHFYGMREIKLTESCAWRKISVSATLNLNISLSLDVDFTLNFCFTSGDRKPLEYST